ncbi:carbohydrate ABC transporter substrate-binding protein, CUT1 family [Paenibacillus sp. yr247]|uniref:extracellular solute-binding protein n=1 Tax=Paenibacillus sp. yr247 TaxID=1761880 RepID=UPI00088856D1|nr:extracellular solute-binding protein [Paenibacillus sp. yr247]SDO35435.1 carbohydrate ABC transporter substrate-binding protein, CUT1 family [Paenibacillus sp. yr247]
MLRINKMVFVAALISVLLVISACSSNNESNNGGSNAANSSASGNASAVDQNKVIDVSFFAVPGSDIIDLKMNWFTNYVKENYKLNISFNIAPSSDAATKQSLLLSSGDYPDVFWSGNFSPSDILKYSKQGIIVPLNKYIDQYAPNLAKAIKSAPGLKSAITAPDGNIYGLPSYNTCWHCFWWNKAWIDKSLLEKYNLQMPTTTDEFEHVLQVFKDNGITPYTGSSDSYDPIPYLMNAFTYDNASDYFDVQDGKVQYAPTLDGWKQGLSYLNNLYKKGLIDKQALSQKSDIVNQMASQGKVGIVPFLYSGSFIDMGSPKYKNWVTIPPLKGPNGVQYAAFSGNSPKTLTFAVTNKATEEKIVRLMKLINFIYSPEGTQMLNYGPEGKYWTKAENGVKGLSGEQALFITQSDKFYSAGAKQNEGWNQMGPVFQDMTWRNGFVKAASPFTAEGLESLLLLETMKNYAGHQPKQVYPGAVYMEDKQNQKFALLKTNIEQYMKQWTAQFILGNKSVDKDWQEYIEGFKKLGLDEYLKISQDAMITPFDTSAYQSDLKTVEFLSSLK